MKRLRVFAASPSDTAAERAKVETVAAILKPLADRLGIVIDVVDWREIVPDMGRPEQVILDQLKPTEWDVFIGILWHRFGTPPAGFDSQTGKEYLSGTEEEFKTAHRLWQQYRKPRIMIYRCTRAVPLDALDADQYKRVQEFFSQFDAVKGQHPGLYQYFDTTEALEKLLLDNLQRLLLEYGEQLRGAPVAPEVVQEFAPRIPDNLPRRAPFFGRVREMDTVLRTLGPEDRTWGILLDGIGGIGKTALAVEAAYRCKERGLFDAFIFISAKQNILDPGGIRELTPAARTLDEFLNETARVLGQTGITRLAGDNKRRALLDELRGTRSLLIYDNLETLAKEEQEALANFLRELPQTCKAITTSRKRSGSGGEGAAWLRLEKLEWEAARSIIESEMARDPQLANKLSRAGEGRWQQLYDETKGSPLALMHMLGLLRVRATLTFDGALGLLRGNQSPDLQRFIFQEARRELTTNDETALRALSFFVPSASFESWAKVADLTRNALETTVDRLNALSLVDIQSGGERYALHPLTRNFVRDELLADEQIAREIGMRFADYWVAYARQYGGAGEESYKTYDRLEAEWDNLDATAEWLWQTAAIQGEQVGDTVAAQKLNDQANALKQFLSFSGRWDRRVQLSAYAYTGMHALEAHSLAGWHAYNAAWIYYLRAEKDEAALWADRCSTAWASGGSKYEQAMGMRMRGQIEELRKDYETAKQLYEDALAIWRELNKNKQVGDILNDLGMFEHRREQYEAAEQYYREGLALAEKHVYLELQASISANLGVLELARERWSEARNWFEKGFPLGREIGRQDLLGVYLYGLALVHEAQGNPDLALPLAQESLAIDERLRRAGLSRKRELVERLMRKVSTSGDDG